MDKQALNPFVFGFFSLYKTMAFDPKTQKPFLITLTGDLGSGKSSLAKRLCAYFEADYYSTGSAQRKLAAKRGVSTLDLNKMAETDPSIDREIDSIFENLAYEEKTYVVDSRMAWHFLPNSFKLRLTVEPETGAVRILGDQKRTMEGYEDVAEALEMIHKRKSSERSRFQNYYGVDTEDETNYDLIVDTTTLSHEAVFEKVRAAVERYLDEKAEEQNQAASR